MSLIRRSIAEFSAGKIIYNFDKLDRDHINYILDSLEYTDHPINVVRDKISKNYRNMLRRGLRQVRLYPSEDATIDYINAIQQRIAISSTRDGTGVGNATSSALTASGTQSALNQKRVTGSQAKGVVGDNVLFDTIRAKQNPADEGTSISYINPISPDTAYDRIGQLISRHIKDFLENQFNIDTALELNIPQWWHNAYIASRHKRTYAGLGFSDTTIFMRLSVDINMMYSCRLSMNELANMIERIKLDDKADVEYVVIPSPSNIGLIDIAIINIKKYSPYEGRTFDIPGYNVKSLQHKNVHDLIRQSIYNIKNYGNIRGVTGVNNAEVIISNVEGGIYDIDYIDDHQSLRYGPLNDDRDGVVVYGNSGAQQYNAGELSIIATNLVPQGTPVLHTTIDRSPLEGSVSLQEWKIILNGMDRVLKGINVIAVLRLLHYYGQKRLYTSAYNVITRRVSITSVEKILLDPMRYNLSGNRYIPNSRLEEFNVYYPGSVRQLLIDSVNAAEIITKTSEIDPRYMIRHRTYGRSFYNLTIEDDNIDRDMTIYSNGNIVAGMMGIEASYSVSVFSMINEFEDKINPQHASMYISHRTLNGIPIPLMTTTKAASRVGPLTGAQLDNPSATFARSAHRTSESTSSTAGFMCSGYNATEIDESSYDTKLDAYGSPIIHHFNKQTATVKLAGFEPYIDSNRPSEELIEVIKTLDNAHQFSNLPTITIGTVGKVDIDLVFKTLNRQPIDPVRSFEVIRPIAINNIEILI